MLTINSSGEPLPLPPNYKEELVDGIEQCAQRALTNLSQGRPETHRCPVYVAKLLGNEVNSFLSSKGVVALQSIVHVQPNFFLSSGRPPHARPLSPSSAPVAPPSLLALGYGSALQAIPVDLMIQDFTKTDLALPKDKLPVVTGTGLPYKETWGPAHRSVATNTPLPFGGKVTWSCAVPVDATQLVVLQVSLTQKGGKEETDWALSTDAFVQPLVTQTGITEILGQKDFACSRFALGKAHTQRHLHFPNSGNHFTPVSESRTYLQKAAVNQPTSLQEIVEQRVIATSGLQAMLAMRQQLAIGNG